MRVWYGGQVLAVKALPFIEASCALGASAWRIATAHILPNVAAPLIVLLTLNFSNIVLLESALSFLGLGVQPPMASLGAMIGQGRDYLATAWWVVATPASLIVQLALVVSLLGDWLRDVLDVRLH
jgi:peptide/nickel transport system permease protein